MASKDRLGRPKQKDLKAYLLDLHWYHWRAAGVEIGLESAVEKSGRSLKPNQLLQLLEQRLDIPLVLEHQVRESLNLAC